MQNHMTKSLLGKIAEISLLAASLACLLLAAVRTCCAISFFTPWLITTTGSEDEALFSIWKLTQGLPVYADPRLIPFANSPYNWGFYTLYGSISAAALRILHLDSVWLPTICRILTLTIGMAGCGLFFLALRESGNARSFWPAYLLPAWSLLVITQPLSGFWLITTRPDIGAVILELAGLLLVLRYLRKPQCFTILFAALALYAAWSFKQTSISVLVGTSATLFLLNQWRALMLLIGTFGSLVAITLWAGGPLYRYCLLGTQTHFPLVISLGMENFTGALLKMPFTALALIGIPWLVFKQRGDIRTMTSKPAKLACLLTALNALLFESIIASKAGASDYYLLPLSIWATLWLIMSADRFTPRFLNLGLITASWLMIFGISLVFLGKHGTYDRRDQHPRYAALAEKLAALPGPIFVTSNYGNLPWVQPHAPYFVISGFPGASREHGGWEGLEKEGYFGTIATAANDPYHHLTAAQLPLYQLIFQDRYFEYYGRKP